MGVEVGDEDESSRRRTTSCALRIPEINACSDVGRGAKLVHWVGAASWSPTNEDTRRV